MGNIQGYVERLHVRQMSNFSLVGKKWTFSKLLMMSMMMMMIRDIFVHWLLFYYYSLSVYGLEFTSID